MIRKVALLLCLAVLVTAGCKESFTAFAYDRLVDQDDAGTTRHFVIALALDGEQYKLLVTSFVYDNVELFEICRFEATGNSGRKYDRVSRYVPATAEEAGRWADRLGAFLAELEKGK